MKNTKKSVQLASLVGGAAGATLAKKTFEKVEQVLDVVEGGVPQTDEPSDEEFEDDDDGPIVADTNHASDTGIIHVTTHAGKVKDGDWRASLRMGERANDVLISRNVVKLTWASLMNSQPFGGEKVWGEAHTKMLFPEHITEMDYYSHEVKFKGRWDLRCPRIVCCVIKCPKYRHQKKKIITKKQVEPCICQPPKCSLCSGLNPVTAIGYIGYLSYCFYTWYNSMLTGVTTGAFVMLPAIKHLGYAAAVCAFLLLCEFITLRNLRQVELETIRRAEEEKKEFSDVWEHHIDENTGHDFYYHRKLGITKWDLSDHLEDDSKNVWVQRIDEKGLKYYHNLRTDESTWERPHTFRLDEKKSTDRLEEKESTEPVEKRNSKATLSSSPSAKPLVTEEGQNVSLPNPPSDPESGSDDEETTVIDDGVEPGGKPMSRLERNLLSVKAIHKKVQNHHRAAILTSCILLWHLLFVLAVGGAAFGKPYKWDGKRRLSTRKLATENFTKCLKGVEVPNVVAQAKLWCDDQYWRMAQLKLEKSAPYYLCPPEPAPAPTPTPTPAPKADCTTGYGGNSCGTGKITGKVGSCACDCSSVCYTGTNCQTAKTCNGDSAPANGAKGTCNGKTAMTAGTTCTPTCSTGYTASGSRSCSSTCDLVDGFKCTDNSAACTTGKDNKACQNGGKPAGKGSDCTCNCPVGYEGSHCQTAQKCSTGANGEVCTNGGTATGTTGKCSCICPIGWSGDLCEISQPDWFCPKQSADEVKSDPFGHLHRAEQACGHCHGRYMTPWVWVFVALSIEILLMVAVAVMTSTRERLGRITTGRFRMRKSIPATYEKGKHIYQPGGITVGEWVPGRFHYIEAKTLHLARLVFTDRKFREWTVYLTQDEAHEAEAKFFDLQSQDTRQNYKSHAPVK